MNLRSNRSLLFRPVGVVYYVLAVAQGTAVYPSRTSLYLNLSIIATAQSLKNPRIICLHLCPQQICHGMPQIWHRRLAARWHLSESREALYCRNYAV